MVGELNRDLRGSRRFRSIATQWSSLRDFFGRRRASGSMFQMRTLMAAVYRQSSLLRQLLEQILNFTVHFERLAHHERFGARKIDDRTAFGTELAFLSYRRRRRSRAHHAKHV